MLPRIVERKDRRARLICSPSCRFSLWSEKHEVRMPVPVVITQVTLLEQHEAHGAGFYRRQFLLIDGGGDGLYHLGFGASSQ